MDEDEDEAEDGEEALSGGRLAAEIGVPNALDDVVATPESGSGPGAVFEGFLDSAEDEPIHEDSVESAREREAADGDDEEAADGKAEW
ncbi:MAG: hypothetical protein FJ029_09805 [Actinobacteria bacterium]|nr:hypothetical protein [Actinomycetota bacterium]